MFKIILALLTILKFCYCSCDSDCINCNSITNSCIKCGNNKVLYTGKCLSQCPETCFQNNQNQCETCVSPCRECVGTATNCLTCSQALWFLYNGSCLQNCSANTIPKYNEKQSYCANCNPNCSSCQGSPDNCTTCLDKNKSLYLGTCINSCPIGSYSQEIVSSENNNIKIKVCSYCLSNCQSCQTLSICLDCSSGYFLSEDRTQCLEKCPNGFQSDIINRRCYRTSCPEGMFEISLDSNQLGVQCSSTCPYGYYIDFQNKKCLKCNSSCSECIGSSEADCLVCHPTCLTQEGSRFDQSRSCTSDIPMIKNQLKFVLSTFNIRNIQDRYHERKEFLRKTLLGEQSDLMCLQEVSFLGNSQVDHLVEDDNKQSLYHQYHAEIQLKFHNRPGADPESKLDGNTVIVKKSFLDNDLQLIEEKKIHLSGFRIAHAMKFGLKNDISKYFWLVNTHLHHIVPDWEIRHHQLQNLHLWLYQITNFNTDNIFICGDFNLTPKEVQNYNYFGEMGFKSTYKVIHKEEPVITFPTGLQAPNMDTDPEGCFDYIWYKGDQIKPQSIKLFGNQPLETDSTIYPSDHMGLSGQFIIEFD